MNEMKDLHRVAMERADLAVNAKRQGETAAAQRYFQEAVELESKAALMLADDMLAEPTRSVLFRSAASLALDCGRYQEAERLTGMGLAGNPPNAIAVELRVLIERVRMEWKRGDMRLSLQDDDGVEIDFLPGIGVGTLGLETVNPATGSVRLTHDMTLALAAMLYQAGLRPDQPQKQKPKDNVQAFRKPN